MSTPVVAVPLPGLAGAHQPVPSSCRSQKAPERRLTPPLCLVPSELSRLGPNVIGATGGSGTRAFARLVNSAGLFIGANRMPSEDAVAFWEYSHKWINTFVRYRGGPIPPDLEREMLLDLAATLFAHLADLAEPRPWGWKDPRSTFLLPFFHQHMPSLRFLHVVRDGRDMAFSRNQHQLNLHGLASGITGSSARDSITLWSRVNMQAADYGEERLGSRYLRVRFEDLCGQPVETASRVLAFFELEADPRLASSGVRTQASIGRWRREDRRVVAGLEEAAGAALARFGYS